MEQNQAKNDGDDGSTNKTMDKETPPIATIEPKATIKILPALTDIIF